MIGQALVVAALTLCVGLVVAGLIARLSSLRMQLAGLALLGVALPLAAVLGGGFVMLGSWRDVTAVAISCAAGSAAVVGTLALGHRITRAISALHAAPVAMAAGDLTARAPRGGPAEVDALAASFNEMAVRLEELFDSRRRLVAWAGHDLRTPLSSLQAMLEALEDGLAEPEEYLPLMHDQVAALSRLVADLFELARLDAEVDVLTLRPAPVQVLVEDALRRARPQADTRGVRIAGSADDTLPTVMCAPEKVGRVLDNLVSNALRHTPASGEVRVLAEPEGDAVRIAVEDTGSGLPQVSLDHMFEHFWRADPARARDGGAGAGLGLAIARGLVEAHGGRIWAENRPGGGARISFTLPIGPAGPLREAGAAA